MASERTSGRKIRYGLNYSVLWIELQRDPLYCQLYESGILDFVLRRSALLPPICPTDSLRQNDDDM
jgi:hypothetical protein